LKHLKFGSKLYSGYFRRLSLKVTLKFCDRCRSCCNTKWRFCS